MNNKKIPINRNSLFYSEKDLNTDIMLGMDFLFNDINQTLILYRVDKNKTNITNIYGEAKKNEIRWLPPVEFHCIYELKPHENKTYNTSNSTMRYAQTGDLEFGVYESHLKELDIDISVGDYIALAVNQQHIEYFVVVDDGLKNYDNEHTSYGYIPIWRTCLAVPVDLNEFSGE